jgi:transcriptional regulator of acetoin/glycerol metabolism
MATGKEGETMKIRKNGKREEYLYDDTNAVIVPLADLDDRPEELNRNMMAGIEEVNEIVQRLGVKVGIKEGTLIFTYSQKEAKEKASRYAGRPRGKSMTVGQIREAVAATDTLDEAAEALGISRRTLYRLLKEINEKQLGHDEYI